MREKKVEKIGLIIIKQKKNHHILIVGFSYWNFKNRYKQ